MKEDLKVIIKLAEKLSVHLPLLQQVDCMSIKHLAREMIDKLEKGYYEE